MFIIFAKLKQFWDVFWGSLTGAYSKAFKQPPQLMVQDWNDISHVNFLGLVVGKLNNLVNTEATFKVEGESKLLEPLKALCNDLQNKRFGITEQMLGEGDFFIFPATDKKGNLVHTYLTQDQVRILDVDGEDIVEAYGIIDYYTSVDNKTFYLLRHHKLDINGTLTIKYQTVDENGRTTSLDKWVDYDDKGYTFVNANHIGFGRYKSPTSSRGLNTVYGVPLNYGCSEIESRMFNDLKMVEEEFKNGKSVIFTDPRNIQEDERNKCYRIADNIIPIQHRAGEVGNNIDIFSPVLRQSEFYAKLVVDMSLYEKAIGTSKGILTDNETSYTATATAVRRANSDTLALMNNIRTELDKGNQMTLKADSVFLNIRAELWEYSSDWFDPFEEPDTQWQRLLEAKEHGVAEAQDLALWLFPNLTEEEIAEKLVRIEEKGKADTDETINKLLGGA